ncbi:MAG: DUF5615 family PIN-like protein [bacterium]
MRLPADVNFPLASVLLLRDAGLDVLAASESLSRATDSALMQRAATDGRVNLTFDRDIGALVYRGSGSLPSGVILLRFEPASPEEPGLLLRELATRSGVEFVGRFTVLDRDRARQRPFPRRSRGV